LVLHLAQCGKGSIDSARGGDIDVTQIDLEYFEIHPFVQELPRPEVAKIMGGGALI
jgi:hypothetical protein